MQNWKLRRLKEADAIGTHEVPMKIRQAITIHRTTSRRILDVCRIAYGEGERRNFANPWNNVTNQCETLWRRWRGIGPLALQHLEEAGLVTLKKTVRRERTIPESWEGADFGRYVLECAINDRRAFRDAWSGCPDNEEIVQNTREEIAAMKERLRRIGG
jgi:hypothetical protein